MSVLDKVGDTLSSVSKDVVGKVKSGSDISKIKQQIVYEEERILDFYTQLGKHYYVDKTSNASEQYAKLCQEIDERSERIVRLKKQINSLKGIKICSSCGSVVTNNFLFCGLCGFKLPDEYAEITTNEVENVHANNGALAFSQNR